MYKESIGKLTRQYEIKQHILNKIRMKDNFIFEIVGPYGCGKKTICEEISNSWENQYDGTIIYLNPQYKIPQEDYSVFKSVFLQTSSKKIHGINIFLETLKDVPYIGNSLSTIVSELMQIADEKKNILQDFSQIECLIISHLQKHIGNTPCLFVCNNVEDWDFLSQNLLYQIVKNQNTNNLFNNSYFILNSNYELTAFKDFVGKPLHISILQRDDIKFVVKEINPCLELNESQTEQLFTLTNGNIKLISECLTLVNKPTYQKQEKCYEIITKKISHESKISSEIVHLLKEAAFIGFSFDTYLLKTFSKSEQKRFEDILDNTINLNLLSTQLDNEIVSFKEEFIYTIFKENTFKDKRYYLHLSECIKLLYPSRYDLQANYLYRGKIYNDANLNYLLFLIKYYRENNIKYYLPKDKTDYFKNTTLLHIYEKICDTYALYKSKKYKQAELLISATYSPNIALRFEIDYLKALITTNQYFNVFEFEERINVLETYINEEFRKNYPEMYIRALMILIELYSETGSIKCAESTLKEIHKFFFQYASTDQQIQYYEYCFKMKANSYYKIEIAKKYTFDAYNYFFQLGNNKRNVNTYYISILNHSANEIVTGNYLTGYNLLCEAVKIVKEHSFLEIIHKDILVNNLLISGFFCNKFSAAECVHNMEEIIKISKEEADNILLENNYLVFVALTGDITSAYRKSKELYENICCIADADDYYLYYVLNNYCILSWLNGFCDEARNVYYELTNLIPLPKDNAYFSKRNQYLEYIFNNNPGEILSNSNWNKYMIYTHPKTIGNAWKFWGHLLLLSELQIWSDF